MTKFPGTTGRSTPKIVLLALAGLAAAVLLFIAYGPGIPALAQENGRGVITRLTLTSNNPGKLAISWDAPEPNDSTLSDYRTAWTPQDEDYVSWRDPNEEHRGNAYPTGTTLTLTGLKQDTGYKVMVRARYNRNGEGQRWSGPWHKGTVRVSGQPAPGAHSRTDARTYARTYAGAHSRTDARTYARSRRRSPLPNLRRSRPRSPLPNLRRSRPRSPRRNRLLTAPSRDFPSPAANRDSWSSYGKLLNRHPRTTGSDGHRPAWTFCPTRMPTKPKEQTFILTVT